MQSIANIQNFPAGTPIDSIQAKLVSTYERKEGQGAKGPWSIQDGEVIDGAGNKLKIKVWNHPDISPMKGREVVIHSSKPGGLKVLHDEYNGKTTIKLEISKNGQFQFIEVWNAQNGGTPAPAPSPATIDVTADVQVKVSGDPAKANEEQAANAKKTINRLANLWLSCFEAAVYCDNQVSQALGNGLPPDQFQACVSSLFIQATRDGANMPSGKYELKKKETPKPEGDQPF